MVQDLAWGYSQVGWGCCHLKTWLCLEDFLPVFLPLCGCWLESWVPCCNSYSLCCVASNFFQSKWSRSSVQFSRSVVSDSWWPHESQHARTPCPSPTPGVHSDSRPSSQWCHLAISSSVVPFSSCPQSLSYQDGKQSFHYQFFDYHFCHVLFVICQVQPILNGRRIKLYILKGDVSKNLWIYLETVTVIKLPF